MRSRPLSVDAGEKRRLEREANLEPIAPSVGHVWDYETRFPKPPPPTSDTGASESRSGFAGHTHVDERGIAVRCYHSCRTAVLSGGFWLGVTVSFPLEHVLWERLWPFNLLTKALGL